MVDFRMLPRSSQLDRLFQLLTQFPVVALLGPRQVGKTTLARLSLGLILLGGASLALAQQPGIPLPKPVPTVTPETVQAPVDAQEILKKIRAFPFELHFQHLIPLQTGIRIRRLS